MAALDRAAGQGLDLDPAIEHVAPLAPDLLALAGIERFEEIVEGLIAFVLPMELLADALWNDKTPAGAAYRAKAKELIELRRQKVLV